MMCGGGCRRAKSIILIPASTAETPNVIPPIFGTARYHERHGVYAVRIRAESEPRLPRHLSRTARRRYGRHRALPPQRKSHRGGSDAASATDVRRTFSHRPRAERLGEQMVV